ncbi:MAG: replicative DNA helicase [Myxococcota bacterium]|nr:replicative DNA helicase [Myxococcota bacterium]
MHKIPQDLGAERAVLGAILINPDSLDRVAEDGLLPDDFSQPSHRLLFDCFVTLAREGKAVDLVTVSGWLESGGKLESVGGFQYLTELSGSVPSVAHLQQYISVVREKALMRRLLTVTHTISEEIYTGGGSADENLEQAESAIFALRDSRENNRMVPIGDVVSEVYDVLKARAESPSDVTGIPTGFRDLDALLTGLQPTDLVILAARPSMGKTAFALNLVSHAALRDSASVALFSLEMSKDQLATRMLTSEARISGTRMRTGHLMDDDWQPLLHATDTLNKAKVFIDDTPAMTVGAIRAKCRRLKATEGLNLVVVDYLQLMRGEGREQSREQEISAISRGLKGLAKEMGLPVVALSQLNRGVEQRADKRPLMSDLRESGAIEQDADVIMFLYRDEVYNQSPENQGLAEVLVRKHRNGSIGEVHLAWRGEFARFENLERNYN